MLNDQELAKASTIQPKDCQCLPEIFIDAVRSVFEEKIVWDKSDLNAKKEWVTEYPAMAKRYDWGGYIKNKNESIQLYEYLLKEIKSMPICKTQTIFIHDKPIIAEKETELQRHVGSILILDELQKSVQEELKAISDYNERKTEAFDAQDYRTATLYEEIATEEYHHAEQFGKRVKELGR